MKIKLPLAVILCAFFSASLAHADVKVGDKPTLQFKDFSSGKSIDLADFHGKIVVVDFWATWCGPCMAEAPHMVATNEKYADKGLQFIGISLDNPTDGAKLKSVMADKKFTWPMSFNDKAIPATYGISSIPQTFIISPDGEVLWRGHPAQIDEPLAEAFKNHPPQLVDEKVLTQAKTQLDQAEKDLTDGEQAKALKAMANFPEAAKVDSGVATRFTAVTKELQDFGNKELESVDPMIESAQYSTAIKKLRELSAAFNGTPVGTAAKAKLTQLGSDPKVQKQIEAEKAEAAAADQLAVANKLKADKKDEQAYPLFKTIAKSYPTTAAGTEAAGEVKAYESNTAFMAVIAHKANAKKAESLLSMADNYRSAGNLDLARAKYQAVIDQFPDTEWAATAKTAMAGLGN